MHKQKLRSEIKEEDTWDLTLIYQNDDVFYKEIDLVKEELPKIKKYEGHILDSAESLLNFLQESDDLERRIYKLYYYTHLKLDEDTTNPLSQKKEGLVNNLIQDFDVLTCFVTPELMRGDYKKVQEYINSLDGLVKYRFNLENIYRYQQHSLNEQEEFVVSRLSQTLSNASNVFEALTDADIVFPSISKDGVMVELTESNYNAFIRSSNRQVRKEAFEALLGTYGKYKNTLATTFRGNVDTLVNIAKLKKFNSSLEASLFGDNLDVSIYNKLIDVVNRNLDVSYDYFKLKKKVLQLDELHLYDIYTPMVKDYQRNFSFLQAKDIVFETLSVLGKDYVDNLSKAFNERWIDIYNNKGKRTGAYSSGFYDTKPYLLLNYEGKYEDVTTLIHELGHSMHTYYSCSNNPYNLSSYNIFVAEVASTVNELLLVHYMIEHSKNNDEKKYFLNQLLELYKSTIYRQVMFAEFERDMHSEHEKGTILTYEFLQERYYQLVKKYFGSDVVCDELIKNEWMRIPHFYYNFYVYKYAIGLSCATVIVKRILNKEENAVSDYLAFLKTGGSDYPANELMVANVSVFDETVYQEAINTFKDAISEFEKLMK